MGDHTGPERRANDRLNTEMIQALHALHTPQTAASTISERGLVERIGVFLLPLLSVVGIYTNMSISISEHTLEITTLKKEVKKLEVKTEKTTNVITGIYDKLNSIHSDISTVVASQSNVTRGLSRRIKELEKGVGTND